MKILISGGHLTPALALIDYLRNNHPDVEIVFCGRLYSQDSTRQPSREIDEINRRGLMFIPLKAPRLSHVRQWWSGMVISWQLLVATFTSVGIVLRTRPTVFVSFGGYVALPLALASYICRVPVVTHEQTRVAGSANRFIAAFARKIAISYPESLRFFPPQKTIVTGNPLRSALFTSQPTPQWLVEPLVKPVLYITGGNQGSAFLNTIVQQALRSLTKNWTVIHQCGAPTAKQNYSTELNQAKAHLSAAAQDRYSVREWVTEAELGWIYQHATAVVSRAGANTVTELTAHHLPALYVPIPFAHFDEQTINAEALVKVGGALLIPQKDLNAVSLVKAVEKIRRYHRSMALKLKELNLPTDADQKLFDVIASVSSRA